MKFVCKIFSVKNEIYYNKVFSFKVHTPYLNLFIYSIYYNHNNIK